MTEATLSKDAKRTLKMINKELKNQPLGKSMGLSDNVEDMLNSLPPEQLRFIVAHYAVVCRILSDQVQKRPIPFELNELLVMVGMKDESNY